MATKTHHNKAAKGGSFPSCSRRFKIVGNYLYAPLESNASFDSAEAARAENRKWTKEAEQKGMRWKGRVVLVENASSSATSGAS